MMTTLTIILCFTAAYSVVETVPEMGSGFVKMKKGEMFTMECNTEDSTKDSFSLYARLPSKYIVATYDKLSNRIAVNDQYHERVNISGTIHKLTMRISDLQLKDSGLYIGCYNKYDMGKNEEEEEEGCNILLFVDDVDKHSLTEKSSSISEPLVLVFALTASTMFVVCLLVTFVLLPKVKALCVNQANDASREFNPVYEAMNRVPN